MRHAIAGLLLLLSPWAAFAAGGFVDGYYAVKADLKVTDRFGSGEDDGDGFGVRGLAPVADSLALTGEYQSISYEDSELDFDQLRAGVGMTGPSGSGLFVEYVELSEDEDSADGYGIHARFASRKKGSASLYGQIGYVSLEDEAGDTAKGLEFSLGVAVPLGPQWSGLLDYRRTTLDDEDDDTEIEFSDLRLGLRLNF